MTMTTTTTMKSTYVHKKGIKYENYHFISWMLSFRFVYIAFMPKLNVRFFVPFVVFLSIDHMNGEKNVTLVFDSNDIYLKKANKQTKKKEWEEKNSQASNQPTNQPATKEPAILKFNAYVGWLLAHSLHHDDLLHKLLI